MWLDAESALCHIDRLVAAARALCGNHADADDLVQDVYLTLLRRPRRLTGGSEPAYLMTMLRNAQIDRHRAAARRPTSALEETEEPADPRSGMRPDRALEHREVLDAVHALASPFRETVVAVDVLGLAYKEAGRALGVPVGTVMSRLARGRERVIGALEPVPHGARG
jgi:RNA polymerase sigma-70 factor (ECF subfamily)